MDTSKLKEALAELQNQRNLLDAAITNIQNVLAMLSQASNPQRAESGRNVSDATPSYIELAVDALEHSGKPMHIKELVGIISELRGDQVKRASLESSIVRHIAGMKERSRLAKFAPSTFGLSIWKHPTLARTA